MSTPQLPSGLTFKRGSRKRHKKYKAVFKDKSVVEFGDTRYEHYKDSVPKKLGGGLWVHKNHLDEVRRKRYRARHSGMECMRNGKTVRCIDVKYSPAWFSYYFLW